VKWLLALETQKDLIVTCRLLNIFRRKGAQIDSLALAAGPEHAAMMVVLHTAEADAEHLFHFLRRMEGVEHVTYYRHEPSASASFVFVDAGAGRSSIGADRLAEIFPGARLIFASSGKFLFEVSEANLDARRWEPDRPEILPFTCVRTTRTALEPQLTTV
jgi:acetolactate synthase small subunit